MSERWQEIANEIASAGEPLNPTAWFKAACKRIAELEAERDALVDLVEEVDDLGPSGWHGIRKDTTAKVLAIAKAGGREVGGE